MKRVYLIFSLFFVLLSVTSCKKVVVNLDGGTVGSNIVLEDCDFEEIVKTKPTKEGYEFAGWYSDESFIDYIDANHITKEQKKQGTAYAKWIIVEESITYNVRSETATITDSGRSHQKMDIVNLRNDYNITDLLRAGYKTITVELSLKISEVNDGYQYVFLYSNKKCTDGNISSITDALDKYVFDKDKVDPSLMYMHKIEHSPGEQSSSWKTFSFTITLDLTLFEDDLYIRYGASGQGEDTWENKEIYVTITPNK